MPAVNGISTEAIAGELDGGARRCVSIRPAQVRFYIDADTLGFGQR